MANYKYIYWHPGCQVDGKISVTVHLLSEHGGGNWKVSSELVAELKAAFPEATDDRIKPGKINKSARVYGFTIVEWSGFLPRGEYPGWHQSEGEAEYSF